MSTLVFVDKENKEPGTHMAPKDGQKLGLGLVRLCSSSKNFRWERRGLNLLERLEAPPALPKAAAKALGTVNSSQGSRTDSHTHPVKPLCPKDDQDR